MKTWLKSLYGKVFCQDRVRRPARRRVHLGLETLEIRETPAVRTFEGIDFVAARFTARNGEVRSAVATTVRVQGSAVDLLRFERGVSFSSAAGADDQFTALGDIWAVDGNRSLKLFDTPNTPIGQHIFDVSDLLGTTGAGGTAFGAGNNAGVLRPTILGAPFTPTNLKLAASPPTVLLKGDFGVNLGPLGTWNIPMPSTQSADPYVVVRGGVASIGADVTFTTPARSFARNDWTFDLNPLTFAFSSAAGNQFSLTGTANIKNPNVFDDDEGVIVRLGTQETETDAASDGMVFRNGSLTRFDMSISTESSFAIKNLKFVPKGIHVVYEDRVAPNGVPAQQVVSISGGASFMKTDGDTLFAGISELDVDLGNDNQSGIVITNGQLTTLHASLTADQIEFGDAVRLEQPELALDYDATLNAYGITGGAKLVMPAADNRSFDVSLGSVADHAPGILIENGELTRFDLAVASDAEFTLMGVTIAPRALHFVYEETDDNRTFIVSGSAAFQFNAGGNEQSIDITLGDGDGETPGIVITNGELVSLHAVVSADFTILKLNVGVDELIINYQRDDASFTLDGAITVSLDSQKFNFDMTATLGNGQHHGIEVQNGELRGVYITLDGGFSLYGLTVQANGLTAQYDADRHRLKLSGGIEVQLSDRIVFGASIEGGGLTIDTATGELGIDTGANGLVIAGHFNVAGFVGVAAEIRYVTSSQGYTIQGSGTVTLPLNTTVGASFTIHNGTLSQIGLRLDREIPLGSTGLYITSISGNIANLDNPTELRVNASVSVRFAKQVLGVDLFTATGNLEVTKDYLRVGGTVDLLNGILGSGRATIDINWTQGVYRLYDVDVTLLAGIVKIGGEFGFNNNGDISLRGFARIQVPDNIDFIGGTGIQLDFGLQVRPDGGAYDNFFAAWGSIDTVIFGTFTVGFRINLDGSGLQVIWDAQTIAPIQPVDPIDVPPFQPEHHTYQASFNLPDASRVEETVVYIQSDRFLELAANWEFDSIYLYSFTGSIAGRFLRNSEPGRTPNERKIVYKPDSFYPADGKIILSTRNAPYSGANVRPKFTAAPVYKQANITQYVVAPDASPGSAEFFMEAYSYAPGAAERMTISIVADEQPNNNAPLDGQLIKTFRLGDPGVTFDTSTGRIQVRYTYNSLADLGPWPYHLLISQDGLYYPDGPSYHFVLTDGGYPLTSVWTQSPDVFIPDPTIRLVAPDWVASGPNTTHFNIQSSSEIDVPLTRLVMQLTPAGSGTISQDDYYILPFTDTADFTGQPGTANADYANYYLNNLSFDRSPTFTGKSTLTVTATQETASGTEYTTVKTIDFVQANAHLVVAAQVSDAHPAEGEATFITFHVTNQADANDRDASNVRLKTKLPAGLAFVDATLNAGTYTSENGTWSIGDLAIGASAELVMQVRALPGTFGSGPLNVTGTVSAQQRNLYPEDTQQTVSITVGTGTPIALSGATLPGAALGEYYGALPPPLVNGATGSGGPYRYVLAGGNLPPGLRLLDDGVIAGWPSAAGEYAFQLDVYDRFGAHSTEQLNTYYITVADGQQSVDVPFSADFSVGPNGSKLPGTFAMRLTSNYLEVPTSQDFVYYDSGPRAGSVYVTPRERGYLTLEVTRQDGLFVSVQRRTWWIGGRDAITVFRNGQSQERTFTVGEPIGELRFKTVPYHDNGDGSGSYSQSGHPIDETCIYVGVDLPPGLELSRDGVLSGAPTTREYGIIFLLTFDAGGLRSWDEIEYNIRRGELTLDVSVPPATGGEPYVAHLSASGGAGGPYTFSAVDGLAPGLTLAADGTLSGTVVHDAPFSRVYGNRVAVVDNEGTRTEATLALRVGPKITIANSSLFYGFVGQPYVDEISVSGGSNTGFTYAWTGNVPAGLLLNASTGVITGMPTQFGQYNVTITVTDSTGASASKSLPLTVANLALAFNEAANVVLEPDVDSPLTLNGTATAPDGLVLTPDGHLTGTPTNKGTFLFSSNASLENGLQWVRQYTVVVSAPTRARDDTATTRQNTSVDLHVLDNDTDPTGNAFRIVSWSEPTSGSLTVAGGVITYTPNAGFAGSDTISYRVRNARGLESTATVSVRVVVTLTAPKMQSTRKGTTLKFSAKTNNAITLIPAQWAGTAIVQVTLTVTSGTLTSIKAKGVTVVRPKTGERVTLTGSATNINKALNGLLFKPAKLFVGNVTLGVSVLNLSNNLGGVESASVAITVTK